VILILELSVTRFRFKDQLSDPKTGILNLVTVSDDRFFIMITFTKLQIADKTIGEYDNNLRKVNPQR
jgi:predicted small integral membrane protein